MCFIRYFKRWKGSEKKRGACTGLTQTLRCFVGRLGHPQIFWILQGPLEAIPMDTNGHLFFTDTVSEPGEQSQCATLWKILLLYPMSWFSFSTRQIDKITPYKQEGWYHFFSFLDFFFKCISVPWIVLLWAEYWPGYNTDRKQIYLRPNRLPGSLPRWPWNKPSEVCHLLKCPRLDYGAALPMQSAAAPDPHLWSYCTPQTDVVDLDWKCTQLLRSNSAAGTQNVRGTRWCHRWLKLALIQSTFPPLD